MDMNMGGDSSSAGTQSTVTANLVIGAAESDDYVQTQKPIKVKTGDVENTLYSNKNHIAGENYPMYGAASVKGDENPRIKMKHLSALVALKIVNQGDGVADNGDSSIEINNVEFVAPEEVVGNFNVTVSQTPIKYDKVSASATAKVNLADANGDGITIEPGDEALVYFAVKPFTAKKDAKITIKINGSPRTVPMPKEINFEAGKVTTLRVPVKLSYPKQSDIIGKTSAGKNILTMPVDPSPIYVNGEKVSAYVVGDGSLQSLVIHGTVVDLFKALDAGFYASTWKDKPAAMTVNRINAWIDGTAFYTYDPLEDAIADEIEWDHWLLNGLTLWAVVPIVMSTFSNGVTRDSDMMHLTQFIDPQTITFNGVISNATSVNEDILIMDEAPIYKELGSAAINSLLTEKFVVNGVAATFEGLKYIIDGKTTEPEAISTANVIYDKLKESFESRGTVEKSIEYSSRKITVDIELIKIFNALISSPEDLMAKLRTMKVEVEISSCPYHADKAAGYGSKASPIPLTNIKGDKNPLIFWGLDAYGPDKSEPSN